MNRVTIAWGVRGATRQIDDGGVAATAGMLTDRNRTGRSGLKKLHISPRSQSTVAAVHVSLSTLQLVMHPCTVSMQNSRLCNPISSWRGLLPRSRSWLQVYEDDWDIHIRIRRTRLLVWLLRPELRFSSSAALYLLHYLDEKTQSKLPLAPSCSHPYS